MSDCLSLREQYFAPGMESSTAPEWTSHLQTCAACRLARDGLPLVDRALAETAQLAVTVPPFDAIAPVAQRAARNQRRRQAVRRSVPLLYTGLAAAALAAGLVAAVLVGRVRDNSPRLFAPGTEMHATSEAKFAILGDGARIRLDAGTLRLAVASQASQTLVMPLGRVFVEVPKLPPGSTLSVRTPDAEVRVHGTRFQVVRTEKETQVRVEEGVVEVRPAGLGRPVELVRAGESVTIGSVEAYREGLRRQTLDALNRGKFAVADKQIEELLDSSADPSQQAEAQALLAWSLSARGKRGEAIKRYRQALTLLPEGQQPLWAENACAELAILVEQESPRDAAPAWTECLRRFPDGVHSALARSRLHATQ